jgi:endonuclease/exonuclease/phosphatase family metal-dependent hydrolase
LKLLAGSRWSLVARQWSVVRRPSGLPRPSTIVHRPSTFFLSLVFLATISCANVVNYTDPAGPRFALQAHPAANPGALKVVTFNIRYAREIDSAIVVLMQDPALRDADVIALQEMDEDGVQRIANALGMSYVYYPAVHHPVDKKDFGPALLARWPIEDDRKVILPHLSLSRRAQRVAVTGRVNIGGEMVQLYAVHLANSLEVSYAGQKDQLDALLNDADSVGLAVIIAGDFNSYDVAGEALHRGYSWPTSGVQPSHHGLRLDHVLYRGLGASADSAAVVHDVRGASDHHPVWALVPVKQAPKERTAAGGL